MKNDFLTINKDFRINKTYFRLLKKNQKSSLFMNGCTQKKSLIIIPRNNTKRRDVFKKQNDKVIHLSTTLNFSCKTSLSDVIKRTEKQSNIYLQLTKK
jgi:hypothetical protein